LVLDDDDVDDLFMKDVDSVIRSLRGVSFFGPAFDDFPDEGKAALIDFTFNYGPTGFKNHFHAKIISPIKAEGTYAKKSLRERWTLAAKFKARWGERETKQPGSSVVQYRRRQGSGDQGCAEIRQRRWTAGWRATGRRVGGIAEARGRLALAQ
jgi:hypothetical protein